LTLSLIKSTVRTRKQCLKATRQVRRHKGEEITIGFLSVYLLSVLEHVLIVEFADIFISRWKFKLQVQSIQSIFISGNKSIEQRVNRTL